MSADIWEEDVGLDLQLVDIQGTEVGVFWELDANNDAMPRDAGGGGSVSVPQLSVTNFAGSPSVGGQTVISGADSGTTNEVYYAPMEIGQSWSLLTTTQDNGTETYALSTGEYWAIIRSISNTSGATTWGVLCPPSNDLGPIPFFVSDTDNPIPRTGQRERRRNRMALSALRVHRRLGTKCTFVEADETQTVVWCAIEPLSDTSGIMGGATDERRVVFHIARQPGFPPTAVDWLGSYVLFNSKKYGVMNARMDNETEDMTSVFSLVCAIHGTSVEY